ncbi:DGQHR domain-containing protein [Aquamicrobium lusatiense]|uniref:DGQHR domain-containing protein n=1 Tax=Aquamicrobium lusatiense TaxID=89772 RepID=A0A7W9RYG8_9HYPH|nr:DGQHR domain-containing protein [Aquamicrobium lusatiense]MBB6010812.1 DGQHR domain-containing protein [Aquamicrobium lusatiense]
MAKAAKAANAKPAKKPSKQVGVKTGALPKQLAVPALRIVQGNNTFYAFSLKASQLWPMVSINRRSETEDRGYQRVLSNARVEAVANHIRSGRPVPNSVLVSLDSATYDSTTGKLSIPAGKDIGWVIDGQHRIAGAHEASSDYDIELCVFAFVGVDEEFQIEQFITINREAKGVPTSLVYDLLSHLPNRKKPGDIATERAAEIANELRHDSNSALYNRIVVTQAPTKGKISITNFVRKIQPHVHPERGVLRVFTLPEQQAIIANYFAALKKVYPEQWNKADNIFFRTVGFGAMMNMFEEIFTITTTSYSGFTVQDIENTLAGVKHFEFASWEAGGSGNKAEMDAAAEFRTDFNRSRTTTVSNRRLKL